MYVFVDDQSNRFFVCSEFFDMLRIYFELKCYIIFLYFGNVLICSRQVYGLVIELWDLI